MDEGKKLLSCQTQLHNSFLREQFTSLILMLSYEERRRRSIQSKTRLNVKRFVPSSNVYNLTDTTSRGIRRRKGVRTNTGKRKRMKSEPRKNGVKRVKQKISPRHFYPVLRIKFFNPENLVSLSSCANTQFQKAATTVHGK